MWIPFKNLGEFHFHQLRRTFTADLLTNGAMPKDVQELLGVLIWENG